MIDQIVTKKKMKEICKFYFFDQSFYSRRSDKIAEIEKEIDFKTKSYAVNSTDLDCYRFVHEKTSLLNKQQEYHLFRKLNYFKFKVNSSYNRRKKDNIYQYYKKYLKTKEQIIELNMRLLAFLSLKQSKYSNNTLTVSELMSEGSVALTKCVDKFDYRKGVRFSTYATTSILRIFIYFHDIKMKNKSCNNVKDSLFEENLRYEQDIENCENKEILENIFIFLDKKERKIIECLYLKKKTHTENELAIRLNVAESTINGIKNRVFKRIRSLFKESDCI